MEGSQRCATGRARIIRCCRSDPGEIGEEVPFSDKQNNQPAGFSGTASLDPIDYGKELLAIVGVRRNINGRAWIDDICTTDAMRSGKIYIFEMFALASGYDGITQGEVGLIIIIIEIANII